MKDAQYFHNVQNARIQTISDRKRGYDTLDIELTKDDGSTIAVVIFFNGTASIEGAKVATVEATSICPLF